MVWGGGGLPNIRPAFPGPTKKNKRHTSGQKAIRSPENLFFFFFGVHFFPTKKSTGAILLVGKRNSSDYLISSLPPSPPGDLVPGEKKIKKKAEKGRYARGRHRRSLPVGQHPPPPFPQTHLYPAGPRAPVSVVWVKEPMAFPGPVRGSEKQYRGRSCMGSVWIEWHICFLP